MAKYEKYNKVSIVNGESVKVGNEEIIHPISYQLDMDDEEQRVKVTLEFYANVETITDRISHGKTTTKNFF